MEDPGTMPNMEDLAGSEFLGRLTLTVTAIPEVTSAAMLAAAASLVLVSWLVRRRWQPGACPQLNCATSKQRRYEM
jgi:hypothetical protein